MTFNFTTPLKAFAVVAGLSGCGISHTKQPELSAQDKAWLVQPKKTFAEATLKDLDWGTSSLSEFDQFQYLPNTHKFWKDLTNAQSQNCTLIPKDDNSYASGKWVKYCGSYYSFSGLYLNSYVSMLRYMIEKKQIKFEAPQEDKHATFRFVG